MIFSKPGGRALKGDRGPMGPRVSDSEWQFFHCQEIIEGTSRQVNTRPCWTAWPSWTSRACGGHRESWRDDRGPGGDREVWL